jgi:hypothetical protein
VGADTFGSPDAGGASAAVTIGPPIVGSSADRIGIASRVTGSVEPGGAPL